MIRKILKYPSKQLRNVSTEVTNFKQMKALFWDLNETLKQHKGLGLAAPQIGISKRALIAKVKLSSSAPPQAVLFINPVIVRKESEVGKSLEACLSVPGMSGYVERSIEIQVQYQDIDETIKNAILLNEEAFLLQHEIDHLDGILYIDYIEETK